MQITDFELFVYWSNTGIRARRAQACGWRYEAHRRGLAMGTINLTTTDFELFVGYFSPRRGEK
jgi:hypothetical protein